MNRSGSGDALVADTGAEKSLRQESGKHESAQSLSAECWRADHQRSSTCERGTSLVSTSGPGDDWMERRVKHRVEELAAEYGLDPQKASLDDVIKARAEQGRKNNEGRVERLRREEASKYNLDPDKAEWKDIITAGVEARKKELGIE